ncbi:hypothetical protein CGLO_12801 [Colletotrichum gloeosporioides Cg-14]|uniref:Uncharacterized protein n=1 Tax=Colletotrichum gloeosporioides (strain Cg-14) TaxID=1237896 RepID=T0JXU2_COLGC|nr:hypothetical protein CGLO_12801 [Colletotrichum gloeosporioides Cg-14]
MGVGVRVIDSLLTKQT